MRLAPLLTAAALGATGLSAVPLAATPAAAAPATVTRMFYLADTAAHPGVYGLYSRDVDGTNVKQLVPARAGLDLTGAEVSPDGTTVAYTLVDSRATQIWLIDSGGGYNHRVAAFANLDGADVSWTQDGGHLLYQDELADDTRVLLLSPSSQPATSPAWSASPIAGSDDILHPTRDNKGGYLGNYPGDKVLRFGNGVAPAALLNSPLHSSRPAASADGSTVVFTHYLDTTSDATPLADLMTLTNGVRKTIATGRANFRSFVDQNDVVYFDKVDDQAHGYRGDLYAVPIDGSAAPTQLTSTADVDEFSVSAAVVPTSYTESGNTSPPDVLLGGTRPTIVVHGEAGPTPGTFAGVDHILCRTAGTVAPTTPCANPLFNGRALANWPVVDTVALSQVYTYTQFVTDVFGNVGSTGASQTMQAVGARVAAPNPTAIGTTSSPFRVVWGQGSGSGVSYKVSWSAAAPTSTTWSAFQTWTDFTTSPSLVFGAGNVPTVPRHGYDYRFRVQVYDGYGNGSAEQESGVVAVPFDQGQASYGAGWKTLTVNDRWQGSEVTTTTNGATSLIRLTGTRLFVVGDRCLTCGDLKVYVDGTLVAKVSAHGVRNQTRQVLWSGYTSPGTHSLRVTAVLSSSRPRVSLDAFAAER